NSKCNPGNTGGEIFPNDFITALGPLVFDPGLLPQRTGFREKTVRYFRINFDIVMVMLFVV
ncbi:MAG: hypothetical protein ACE5I8_10920, partial [Thermodesulfobacteriota bacterium]